MVNSYTAAMDQQIDVRALRTSLRLSQQKFGEIFGVDQTTVSDWERKGVPKRGTTRKMLQHFAMFGSIFSKEARP